MMYSVLTIVIAEGADCHILYRHSNDAINLAVGRDSHDTPAKESAESETTFRIDHRVVRQTPLSPQTVRLAQHNPGREFMSSLA